jgi:hypothetical protein
LIERQQQTLFSRQFDFDCASVRVARPTFGYFCAHGFQWVDDDGEREFKPAEIVRCAPTEPKQVTVEALKANGTMARVVASEFQRQWPVAGARHVLAQLFLATNAFASLPGRCANLVTT